MKKTNLDKNNVLYIATDKGQKTKEEQEKEIMFIYDEQEALMQELYLMESSNDEKY